jgi:hypothetical protein
MLNQKAQTGGPTTSLTNQMPKEKSSKAEEPDKKSKKK